MCEGDELDLRPCGHIDPRADEIKVGHIEDKGKVPFIDILFRWVRPGQKTALEWSIVLSDHLDNAHIKLTFPVKIGIHSDDLAALVGEHPQLGAVVHTP